MLVFSIVATVSLPTEFRNPIPSPFFVRPEIFTEFTSFTVLGELISSSLSLSVALLEGAPPIRLEKNILPLLNKSIPSVKKALFSPKVCSKGPKLSSTLSNAT